MTELVFHSRRLLLSHALIGGMWLYCRLLSLLPKQAAAPPGSADKPLDAYDPTAAGTIENPYVYYRWLRDERPVFKPQGQDFYCISRYADIQAIAKSTQAYSSNIVSVLLEKALGKHAAPRPTAPPGHGSRRNFGVSPVDVLAIQDPPAHKYQKLLTHQIVSADYVRALIPDVQALTTQLVDDFIGSGQVEFMNAVAWKLPMLMAMRLVGYPERDYEKVKSGCAHTIKLLSGTTNAAEYLSDTIEGLKLFQYCWQQYREAKRAPTDNITGGLIRAASDPAHPLTDEEAVSIIFQLLIAGSDSSASTMGNALRLLTEHPEYQSELRGSPERIDAFIEEVLRLESAFQGHFRLVTQDSELHGVPLPRGTRLFLLWASGNRDERYWGENADSIDLDRDNIRRHLTFGFGLHACLGRELARMEIRIVLDEMLRRCVNIRQSADVQHVASLFTRTLVKLPIQFEPAS